MSTIQLPSKHNINYEYKPVYISADDVSVYQFCIENNISTGATYTKSPVIFSNDGGNLYQWYSSVSGATYSAGWNVEFGYTQIVQNLNY